MTDAEWMTRGSCNGRSWLFDSRGDDELEHDADRRHRRAIAYCSWCPVLNTCRGQLLRPSVVVDGVVAGTTELERRLMFGDVEPEPVATEAEELRAARQAVVASMAATGNYDGTDIALELMSRGLSTSPKLTSVKRQVERDKKLLGVRTVMRNTQASRMVA